MTEETGRPAAPRTTDRMIGSMIRRVDGADTDGARSHNRGSSAGRPRTHTHPPGHEEAVFGSRAHGLRKGWLYTEVLMASHGCSTYYLFLGSGKFDDASLSCSITDDPENFPGGISGKEKKTG